MEELSQEQLDSTNEKRFIPATGCLQVIAAAAP